jgi:HAD superfamily hydrolase (TIGR01509 family)
LKGMEGIRGVFFDLHGTLLVPTDIEAAWDDWLTAFHSCMGKRGLTMSRGEFKDQIGDLFDRPVPDPGDAEASVFERRVKDLGERLGLEIDLGYLRRMVDHVIGVWHGYFRLDPKAQAVLEYLKPRFNIALITNWDHAPWIYRLLSEHEIGGYFDSVLVSDEVGASKPDPRIFRAALEGTGLEPHEVVHVGDSPEDVKGAMAAGIQPILISRDRPIKNWSQVSDDKETPLDEESEGIEGVVVIRDLSELLDLF